jgi:predicted dehydrogenase
MVLKCGIVGCGGIFRKEHKPYLSRLKGVEICSICDPDESAAVEASRYFGIRRVYKDLAGMLKDIDLDFVDICAPPQFHCELAAQALEAKLHVLLEKPMALNCADADRMIFLARENKVKLCVMHNNLFDPLVRSSMGLVVSGRIGQLLSVEIRYTEMPPSQSDWSNSLPLGRFSDFMPHAIYLLSAFLGPIRQVKAYSSRTSNLSWVKADQLRLLVTADMGLGYFYMSCNSAGNEFNVDIFGKEGVIRIDLCHKTITEYRYDKRGVLRPLVHDKLSSRFRIFRQEFFEAAGKGGLSIVYKNGFHAVIAEFVKSIINDTETPITAEEARETVSVCEDIFKQLAL